jgi:hypothetical protein
MAARKPLITRLQYVMRFEAEKARQQLRYCEHLELWRHCPDARCRRHRICSGNAPHCMLWAHNNLTADELSLAQRGILAALPMNISAPERAAQHLDPRGLFTTTTVNDAFAQYLRDQKSRRRTQQSALSAMYESFSTRRIYKFRFDFEPEVYVEFLHTPIVEVVQSLLPRSDAAVTWGRVVRWDGGLYFHTDLKMPLFEPRTEVTPTQIVYCADPQAFAIPFGRRPMPHDEKRRRDRPCHIWARLLCDISMLQRVKDGATITVNRFLPPPDWRKP